LAESEAPKHPFLSGRFQSPDYAERVSEILRASQTVEDFVKNLREAGFTVEREEY
jgi:hypothetical protein